MNKLNEEGKGLSLMYKRLMHDLFSELSLSLTEVSLFHEMINTKLYMYM